MADAVAKSPMPVSTRSLWPPGECFRMDLSSAARIEWICHQQPEKNGFVINSPKRMDLSSE